jgi:hypothetical protein
MNETLVFLMSSMQGHRPVVTPTSEASTHQAPQWWEVWAYPPSMSLPKVDGYCGLHGPGDSRGGPACLVTLLASIIAEHNVLFVEVCGAGAT